METDILYDNQNNISQNTRLLKPNEVAARLNISRSFVYYLLTIGEIPVVRMGKSCRVRPQDLDAYIVRNIHQKADYT